VLELVVKLGIDRRFGDRQREVVGRKLIGVAAKHVARELIEQDHRGNRGQRVTEEALDRILPFGLP